MKHFAGENNNILINMLDPISYCSFHLCRPMFIFELQIKIFEVLWILN